MIVQMSKYAFMVYHREYDQFLQVLRDLGVLHVRETNSILDNEQLQTLLAERKRVNIAVRSCKAQNEKVKGGVTLAPASVFTKQAGFDLLDQYDDLLDRKAQYAAVKATLEKDMAYMGIWGDFSWSNFNKLKRSGYDVTFFSCPTTKYEPKWADEYNAILINEY